jgi:hypothetical protein
MASSRTRENRLDYRQIEVGRVMERWRASESCSLIGVGSVGKSNLMQHLADPRVQSAYMEKSDTRLFRAIIIDPSMLGPLPTEGADAEQIRCWAGYELMMHRLFMAFYRSTEDVLSSSELTRLYEIYQALQNGQNPIYAYMGLRYFELALDIFMARNIQIVFMFDEFEEMLTKLPVKFFLALRGLRDANKKLLSYLTFTRVPLPQVLERADIDLLAIEQFIELFNDNVYFIGPYDEKDGRRMVDDLMRRNQKTYDEATIVFLMGATGRFAGLLRAGFRILDSMKNLNSSTLFTRSEQLAEQMSRRSSIRTECRTIWMSLSAVEQYVLKAAAGLGPFQRSEVVDEAVELLGHKSLLIIDDGKLRIEPPVFRYYVMSASENGTA